MDILPDKNSQNPHSKMVLVNLDRPYAPIDPSRQIAESPILSLRQSKALHTEDLRAIASPSRIDDLYSFKEMGNFEAQNSLSVTVLKPNTLPIGLNRISWKLM